MRLFNQKKSLFFVFLFLLIMILEISCKKNPVHDESETYMLSDSTGTTKYIVYSGQIGFLFYKISDGHCDSVHASKVSMVGSEPSIKVQLPEADGSLNIVIINIHLGVWSEQNSLVSSAASLLPPETNPLINSTPEEIAARNCK